MRLASRALEQCAQKFCDATRCCLPNASSPGEQLRAPATPAQQGDYHHLPGTISSRQEGMGRLAAFIQTAAIDTHAQSSRLAELAAVECLSIAKLALGTVWQCSQR